MGIASDTYANLTRQQYQDWQNTYYPHLQQLMTQATDGSLMNQQLARVDQNQQQALSTATVGAANQAARYGATAMNNQQDNSSGLKAALATAGAKNGTREAQQDRELNILTGGNASLRQALNIGGS